MCKAIREGDEMACSCGLRWDVDEADPHTDDVGPHTGYELAEDPVSEIERIRKELIEQGAHVTDDDAELATILGIDLAHPDSDRSVVNGHVLYRASDFNRETEFTTLGIAVIDGGLQVCKICGEYESGLSNPCKGEA